MIRRSVADLLQFCSLSQACQFDLSKKAVILWGQSNLPRRAINTGKQICVNFLPALLRSLLAPRSLQAVPKAFSPSHRKPSVRLLAQAQVPSLPRPSTKMSVKALLPVQPLVRSATIWASASRPTDPARISSENLPGVSDSAIARPSQSLYPRGYGLFAFLPHLFTAGNLPCSTRS